MNTHQIGERGLIVGTTVMAWLLRAVATQETTTTVMELQTRLIAVRVTSLHRKWDQLTNAAGSILGTASSWIVVATMRWWWEGADLGGTWIVLAAPLMETYVVNLILSQNTNPKSTMNKIVGKEIV